MRRAALLALVFAAGCAAPPRPPSAGPVGALVVRERAAGSGARFVGSGACRGCHPAAYERWARTGHARAFAGLAEPDRRNPVCLRCHVTGYADPLGFGRDDGGSDLAAVGCEACHGPGADHARSGHPGLVPTATGGECPPCEANRICRLCHTPERSPDFQLGPYLSRVSCRP